MKGLIVKARALLRLLAAPAALACAAVPSVGLGPAQRASQPQGQPVLYVTIDDVGADLLQSTPTPFLDALALAGVVYDRFVASPNCSCTRAKVESGFYSIRPRNGIGGIFKQTSTDSLPVGDWLLAQRVSDAAQVGKWHLCEFANLDHRAECGYVSYGGSQANLVGESYYDWEAVVDGSLLQVQQYATDWTVARARAEVDAGRQLVAAHFNAVHVPIEAPPGSTDATVEAMLQYLDWSLSQLVPYAVREGYAVVILSDNGGTAAAGGKGDLGHDALATLLLCIGFERPLQLRSLVDCTDVHATIVDAATGSPPTDTDGVSLLDQTTTRDVAFADHFVAHGTPGAQWEEMATDGNLKVIRKPSTGEVTVTDWFDAPSSDDPSFLLAALDSR